MITEPFRDLQGADAYELLGVPPNASADEIQRAYRERMKSAHLDAQPRDGTLAQLLNVARDVLTGQRPAYDAYRQTFARPAHSTMLDEEGEDIWSAADPGVPHKRHAPPSGTSTEIHEVDQRRMTVHRPGADIRRRAPIPYGRRRRTLLPVITAIAAFAIVTTFGTVGAVHIADLRFDSPVVAIPKQLAGTWVGTMVYQNHADRLPIRISLQPGRRAGRIEYDDGGAELIAIRRSEHRITLRTDIRRRDGTFKPGQITASRRPRKGLRISAHLGTHEVASASLRRAR